MSQYLKAVEGQFQLQDLQDLHDPVECRASHYASVVSQVLLWLSNTLDASKIRVVETGDDDRVSTRIYYGEFVVFYGTIVEDENTGKTKCVRQVSKIIRGDIRHFIFENRPGQ